MHLFYTPDIDQTDTYQLNEEESKHCTRVLRLQQNDEVNLIDGRGGLYTAAIIQSDPKRTVLKILSYQSEFGKRNHYLHIAVAPTKNIERLEWFLEKATEIGIDRITPIICDRSERKEVKTERLNKVITSAVKQSLKAYHPQLDEPVKFRQFVSEDQSAQKFIAHCIDSEKADLRTALKPGASYRILIGPEGDFTPAETQLAISAGYVPLSLGTSRLRTETAALEACFEINFLNR